MRLTVVTSGGEGDTRPLAAVCRGLIDAGHEVCLFTENSALEVARSLDVPSEATPGDLRSALGAGNPRTDLRVAEIMAVGRQLKSVVNDNASGRLRAVFAHAKTADAVLFSTFAVYLGQHVALQVGIPAIGLWLQPLTPTREFHTPVMPPMRLPGWLNRASYGLTYAYLRRTMGRAAADARREVFDARSPADLSLALTPMLYGVSPTLVPQPRDWPIHHRMCGQFHARRRHWQPTPELREFLASGPPPLYLGFGSSAGFVRGKALSALIDAVAGRRAIFGRGWSAIDAEVLPANFRIVDDVPHDWLFPQVSVVIHHGGSGTTHSAARAGTPSVILPLGGDQFFWADAAGRAGIAPPYTKGARLKSSAIRSLIEAASTDSMQARVKQVASQVAAEDGVATAVMEIQQLVQGAQSE